MGETEVVRSFLAAMRRHRPVAMLRLTTPDFSFVVRDGRVAEIQETAHDLAAWHAFWG